jgi:UDP-glucose 4-epimerase
MESILVSGGAGYIGSHVVRALAESGMHPVVFDNLSEGHAEAVRGHEMVVGDINDGAALREAFRKYDIKAVMHFSAFAYVGESVTNPEKYYLNNVGATLNLLAAMKDRGIDKFIFSSSCATFGDPLYLPIDEIHPQSPVNPYGRTKLMVEEILKDYHAAYGLKYFILRYFNAAGAHPDGTIGESHRIETHLIPLVLKTLTGEKQNVSIFGTDYDTSDGTCIRDYIHVCDLASAHLAALNILMAGGGGGAINLGTGKGKTVREIITAVEEVTGKTVPVVEGARRAGDPAGLYAANGEAKKILHFNPQYMDIREIIKTAWNWELHKKY